MNPNFPEQKQVVGIPVTPLFLDHSDWLHFPDICITLSEDGTIQFVNKAFEGLFGKALPEIKNQGYKVVVYPDDYTKVKDFISNLRTQGSATNFVHRVLKPDGSFLHISWSGYLSEKEKQIFLIGRDITELMVTQQKQLAKEHLFQALIENSFDILTLTDENGRFLYVSDTLTQVVDYKPSDLLGTNCFDYMHPDDLPRIMEQYQGLLDHDKKIQVPPYRFRNATGDWIWMEAIVTNQLNNPDIRGVVVSVRDINRQVNTEKKLQELQLLGALMEGEEKERSRIARDLHDEISGTIAAAKMHFAALTAKAAHLTGFTEYNQGMELLATAARQVRRTSHNLMPEILLENGLAGALERYCYNISSHNLTLEFFALGTISRFSANFELLLYRITQELINNIVKHAQASKALVQLSQQGDILALTVEDNGVGFSPNAETRGTGLKSVSRRVAAMNGYMEVQAAPGKGTQVYLEFQK